MGNIKAVCTDTVRDSFNDKVPVGEAVQTAYHDSYYWEHGF